MKKIGIILLVFLVLAAAIVYHYRYDIFQYSVESIIRNNLPPYLSIKEIEFDLDRDVFTMKGISIKNPKAYLTKFLVNVDLVSCRYQKKGKNIWDGIEITSIRAENPVITVERSEKGKVNLAEMGQVMAVKPAPSKKKVLTDVKKQKKRFGFFPKQMKKDISGLVKLTDTVQINGGEVFFLDRFLPNNIAKLRCENINGVINVKLSDDYTKVLLVESRGSGVLNGDSSQRVDWVISLDPTGSRIKMSNTFEIANIDLTLLEPYYEKFSPIVIDSGRCSGTLVFNFDGDDIGSMNTLKIRDLKFSRKSGSVGFKYWQVPISEVITYLQSAPGEIIFDFKIKGSMDDPKFYPGPYLKKALQNMVVDKVTNAIGSFTEDTGESDVDKVIGIMKGIFGD